MSSRESQRLAQRIFDLEHELGIGGHNDGYSCMECWRLEDEARRSVKA
jgi:hypothetical protein